MRSDPASTGVTPPRTNVGSGGGTARVAMASSAMTPITMRNPFNAEVQTG